MPRSPHYPPELRRSLVEVVRPRRSPIELAEELEPSEQCIRNWAKQSDRDSGRRQDGLTPAEKEELGRLRRENRVLREERTILAKAAAWFARETGKIPSSSNS
jgi:transposase